MLGWGARDCSRKSERLSSFSEEEIGVASGCGVGSATLPRPEPVPHGSISPSWAQPKDPALEFTDLRGSTSGSDVPSHLAGPCSSDPFTFQLSGPGSTWGAGLPLPAGHLDTVFIPLHNLISDARLVCGISWFPYPSSSEHWLRFCCLPGAVSRSRMLRMN